MSTKIYSPMGNQDVRGRFDSVDSDVAETGAMNLGGNDVPVQPSQNHVGPPPPQRANEQPAVDPDRQQKISNATKPFRQHEITKARTRWTAGVGGTAAVVGGAAASTALATKGAFIGGMIGTAIMPGLGTAAGIAIGAAIGGIAGFLSGGAIGGAVGFGIGNRSGKQSAAQVSVDSIAQKFGPGGPKFDKLARSVGADPNALTEQQKNRISEGLRTALQARAAQGQPFGKAFVERTVKSLTQLNTRTDLSDAEKAAVGQKLASILDAAARKNVPIAAGFVDGAIGKLATAETSARATTSALNLDEAGKQLVNTATDDIVTTAIAKGRAVDEAFLAAMRAALTDIASSNRLDAQGKTGAVDAFKRFATGLIDDREMFDKATLQAVAKGMVEIHADDELSAEAKREAVGHLASAVHEQRHMLRPVTGDFTTDAARHAIDIEHSLAAFDPTRELDQATRKEIETSFRRIAGTQVNMGKPLSDDARAELLESLRNEMTGRLAATDDEVAQHKNVAAQAMDRALDELLNPYSEEYATLDAVKDATIASRQHTDSRFFQGLKFDNAPDLRRDGSRRSGGDAANDDYGADLHEHVEAAIKRRNLSPEEARVAYDRLMGKNGTARSLYFGLQMANSSHALANENPQHGTFAANSYVGMPLQTIMTDLAERGGIGAKAREDFPALSTTSSHGFSPSQKVRDYLESQVPAHVTDPQERRRLVQQAIVQHRGIERYRALENYRFDINQTRPDRTTLEAAKLDASVASTGKDAVMASWPAMHAKYSSSKYVERREKNQVVGQQDGDQNPGQAAQVSQHRGRLETDISDMSLVDDEAAWKNPDRKV